MAYDKNKFYEDNKDRIDGLAKTNNVDLGVAQDMLISNLTQGSKYKGAGVADQGQWDTMVGQANMLNTPLPTANPTSGGYPTIPTVSGYSNPFEDKINDQLSRIQNMKPFSYDPANDQSYQAYLGQMQGLGQTAFNNQLGAVSAMTGGRPNSWSQGVATQAQNKFLSEASAAMPQFEQSAFNKYQQNYNMEMDTLNAVLNLDDRTYKQYRQGIEDEYQQYAMEYQQYQDALTERKTEIQRAYDRTKMIGYVSNEDANILGVPPGTPSFEATQRAWEMEDWIAKQEKETQLKLQQIQAQYQKDKNLIAHRESFNNNQSKDNSSIPLSKADIKERDREISDYKKYVKSRDFLVLPNEEKMAEFERIINGIIEKTELTDKNGYPLMNPEIANSILKEIMESSEYKKHYETTKEIYSDPVNSLIGNNQRLNPYK